MRRIQGAGGKGGPQSPRLPVEATDTLRSTSFARVLDLLSEGEIEGLVEGLKSVYLDGTPVQNPDGTMNFSGVSMSSVNGTQSQEPISGFSDTEQEFSVGQEVLFGLPITKTITNPEADAARIRLSIPALLTQNQLTGDVTGAEVQVAIAVQSNGGGFVLQPLSKSFVPVANPATILGTGVDISIRWTLTNSFTFETVKFDVQYREVGAGSWVTLKQDSFTSAQTFTNRGPRFYGTPFTIDRSYMVTGLPELYYEGRVVITSGPGTITIQYFSIQLSIPFDTIRGKASSPYQRSYRVPLEGDPPWDIRVIRDTADSATSTLQNKTVFDTYAEITEEKFSHPNSACVGLGIDAEQFSTIPTRGYDVKLLRVKIPSNYDPVTREYTGIWDGTFVVAWTDNPAWCFYDLLLNSRYGLGNYLSATQIDKWALYTIGQYCDGLVSDGHGGLEPRFTCNLYLQTQEEAFNVISSMASIFRGMAYWQAGAITATQDSPADPVFLFTEANVEDGLFTYSGSAKSARHTVAMISWSDPEDGYKLKPEYVEDADAIARFGVSIASVAAFGCTSQGEAHRAGEWLLFSERYETEICLHRCGHDGVYVRPGLIYAVHDQHRAGLRHGGRITAATTSSLAIDAPITILVGQVYTVQVVMPDGTLESREIIDAPGVTSNLTPITAFSDAPVVGAVWILTSTALAPRLYRCIAVAEIAPNKYEVTGLLHIPAKFDFIERDIPFALPNYSTQTIVPATPEDVVIEESLAIRQGIVIVIITIRWSAVQSASRYRVEYRRDSGNYVQLPEVSSTTAEIIGAIEGFYEVRVTARNVLGNSSAIAGTADADVVGKTALPANITGFGISQNGEFVEFAWLPVADLDLNDYEIRRGLIWEAATFVARAKDTHVSVLTNVEGTYMIKARDTSGNYSLTAATAIFVPTDSVYTISNLNDPIVGSPGVHDNTIGRVDGLTLANQISWATLINPWTANTDPWTAYYDPYESGVYITTFEDFLAVMKFRPTINPIVEQESVLGDMWSHFTLPWSSYTAPWTGDTANISLTYEIAISQDGATFGAFQAYHSGYYIGRACKIRVTLSTADPSFIPLVTSLQVLCDAPFRDLHFEDEAISNTGAVITFNPEFNHVVTVNASIQGGSIGDNLVISNKLDDSVRIDVYDAAGFATNGVVDIDVLGYGYIYP